MPRKSLTATKFQVDIFEAFYARVPYLPFVSFILFSFYMHTWLYADNRQHTNTQLGAFTNHLLYALPILYINLIRSSPAFGASTPVLAEESARAVKTAARVLNHPEHPSGVVARVSSPHFPQAEESE